MTVAEGGGIFVSYRRHESSHLAGRLYDRLADRFGEDQVFIDVDTIEPGVDFAEEIFRAVAACKVLLAIIGPTWLTATDEQDRRRLDDPDDIVRLEIEAALTRDVRVIPILVEGAVMPGRDDLPESLAGLARRNALFIRHESFRSDAGRLVLAIERVLAPAPGTAAVPSVVDVYGVRSAGKAVGEVAQKGSGSSRNDLARAAGLITEAERIAQSLTNEEGKQFALSEVAEALAVTDPDRAERIARSITGQIWKQSALSGIAKALAATDPDRAERIAQSLIDESSTSRSITLIDRGQLYWDLTGVAEALAVTDPDRAERIAQSLIAQSLIDESSKKKAGDDHSAPTLLLGTSLFKDSLFGDSKETVLADVVARVLAVTDPDRAERIARSITSDSSKATALSGIAKALAATDPDRAERIARSITSDSSKATALSGIAKALAATDPDRAERIARSITSDSSKATALSGIAKALAATDPDRAVRLITDAEHIARSVTSDSDTARALSGIVKAAEALAATDPDRAVRFITDAERIAQLLTDEDDKAGTLAEAAKALAATDPDRAERIAWSITSDSWKAAALSGVAKALPATSS